MQRTIEIKLLNEAETSAEDLYELRKEAYVQWSESGLLSGVIVPIEQFRRYLKDKTVFVAHDTATGELLAMHIWTLNRRKRCATGSNLAVVPSAKHEGIASRMLQEEIVRLQHDGFRYLLGSTAIPATWSVQWHLKNGYYIVGYNRSEKQNYVSYIFRKQIAIDIRHHPTDLFWTHPIAPLTTKILYVASYLAVNICKTRTGQLNWIGRMARRIMRKKLRVPNLHRYVYSELIK